MFIITKFEVSVTKYIVLTRGKITTHHRVPFLDGVKRVANWTTTRKPSIGRKPMTFTLTRLVNVYVEKHFFTKLNRALFMDSRFNDPVIH